ncbi:MAG: M61 family metallopeptidase [Alphaproteobacteria bacterium]|nr:M61 family metallopeptidase [Alphaproteobacteria bacterium]
MKQLMFAFVAAATLSGPALAQPSPGPEPAPMPPKVAAPQDVAYPGVIRLDVDATDTEHGIFRVHEVVPVPAGPVTLLYPEWLPGNHSPSGPLDKFAGLVVRANGKEIPWVRDPVNVWAFHIDVPAGATALDLDFQYLSPTARNQGRIVMTPEMLNLQWNAVALYPAGYYARRIMVDPSVRLPAGWKFGTALESAAAEGDVTRFKPVNFATLVDSPMFAGRYFRRIDLDAPGPAPVHLDIVADSPELLDATPAEIQAHKNLVQQAYKLYGSHHYNHYDFLLALSDRMGGIGLEHHRSSEDGTIPGYFRDWAKTPAARDLLAHEYTHSWNGKFRRPADLWTPNFNVPMRDSLLWVYEGQTQFWGYVLAARSGLLTKQEGLDALAATAAIYDNQSGRLWRPLEDTTNDPIVAERRPIPWRNWQRSEDYYSEGQLIWLDADTLIREKTGGKKSLDDFARLFFGVDDGSWVTHTYTFDDIVRALNEVMPYDWAGFLKTRIYDLAPKAPLDGLARGGWKLVYTDTPTEYFKSAEVQRKITDLSYSLGLMLDKDGGIISVAWNGPAFKAGLTLGGKVMSVNGITYDADRLKQAITDAKGGQPIDLIVKTGDHYRTVAIDYRGGLRYPRLERIPGTPDRLSALYSPK